MPGLSGIDLQDILIARGHRTPIIFITAYPEEDVRARAMKAGAVGFLSKPVNHDHLVGHLENALKARLVAPRTVADHADAWELQLGIQEWSLLATSLATHCVAPASCIASRVISSGIYCRAAKYE